MASDRLIIGGVAVAPGEKKLIRLPVANLLVGCNLTIPVHVVRGINPGPTMGLTSAIHGAEYTSIRVLREIVVNTDPRQLAGTIVAVPVANPITLARSKRSTPETDIDFGNMNRVFPGRRAKPVFGGGESQPTDRTLTEMMASVITDEVLDKIEYLIDYHSHYDGCAVFKMIKPKNLDGRVGEQSLAMNRAFGLGTIHLDTTRPFTASGYCGARGVPVCVVEVGGSSVGLDLEDEWVEFSINGTRNVMKYLGMIEGSYSLPERQLVFENCPKRRPTVAGYLVSRYQPDQLWDNYPRGVWVEKGQPLATVFDPYSFEVLEELEAPATGLLYMCKRTGLVEAGSHAFGVAEMASANWIE
mgnify:CR=1 FL=1